MVSRTFPESLPVINIPTHPCNHTKDSDTFSSERNAIAAWFLVRDPYEKLGCPLNIFWLSKNLIWLHIWNYWKMY